ncbi:MAG TPA: hypothetical protein VFD89_01105 [Clostridia bacterium]|nr:hypothetical protein [Clostridia bacterium]
MHFGYFTDYDLEFLDRHINWTDILKSYAISHEELNTIIKESKNDIYHQFENHLDGKHFNGEMFGISSLDQFYRTNDRYESPGINIVTYSTDYFTMNSMAEILKRLRARRPEVRMEIGGLSYFRNSIGVNVLLILPSTNEIVMVKRSKHSSYTEEKRLIYPSTVETLSIADETSKINIDLCVYRGIEEELGLTIDELDTKSLINYAMFFENNYFQDNFVLSISADESITLQNIRDRLAKDRMLEIEEIDSIPNNKRAIDRYIARNKNNMQFQTIYCLEIYKKMTF